MSVSNSNEQSVFEFAQHSTPMRCKHCGGDAHLMRMQPAGSGREQRTFECAKCQQQLMLTVST